MKDSNSDIEIQLLKKDFEYLKDDARKKDIIFKEAIDNLKDDARKKDIIFKEAIDNLKEDIDKAITKKFDQEMLVFKNKYYNFFYVILGGTFVTAVTLYKTFIK